MSDEDNSEELSSKKVEKILEGIVEIRNDVKHLTSRMDTRAAEIEKLTSRVEALEVKLAVNDHKTEKNSNWFDYIFKGALVIIAGYVATKVGLK